MSKLLIGYEKKHKDDISSLKKIFIWEIESIPENNLIEETNYPDWYGYKRIDRI